MNWNENNYTQIPGTTSASADNIPSGEMNELYTESVIATTVILTVISISGIIGNSLVVWAFKKQVSQGVASGLLILLLACCDLFICLIIIPSTLYLDIWLAQTTDWVCRAHMAIKGLIVPVSACLLVLIAVERFLLICFIPGVPMKRHHLFLTLGTILITGFLLAVPMALHVRAIEQIKQKDELLDPRFLRNDLHQNQIGNFIQSRQISTRCDKDDRYISDHLYWYYQMFVFALFICLFVCTAGLYVVIFVFIWRHESLMYERYGAKNSRGYWIRIQATPTSSDHVKFEKINNLNANSLTQSPFQIPAIQIETENFLPNSLSESIHCACSCGSSCDHTLTEQQKTTTNCEIPTRSSQTEIVLPSSSSPCKSKSTHVCGQTSGLQTETNQSPFEDIPSDNEDYSSIDPNILSHKTRTQWAAAVLERKRRPHIRTAKTLALIAATFIVSYTPYLISTIIPIKSRSLNLFREDQKWFEQFKRVLFYLYFINSAINPIIYSCMNQHYQTRVRVLMKKFRNMLDRSRSSIRVPDLSTNLQILSTPNRKENCKQRSTIKTHLVNQGTNCR